MEVMKKIRELHFYAIYFSALTLFTSYVPWFDAAPASWMLVIIMLALPYLLVRTFIREKAMEKKLKRGKGYGNYLIYAGTGCFLSIPGVFMYPEEELMPSVILATAFLFLTLYFCIYSFAYNSMGKVLYRNPSVTRNTAVRAEQFTHKRLRKILLLAIGMAVFAAALLWMAPNVVPFEPMERKQQEKLVDNSQKIKKEENREQKIKEKNEEAKNNIFLSILRYVLFAAIVVMTVLTVGYALFRLLLFLLRRRRGNEVYYVEEKMAETDSEEYSRLVPVVRRGVSFPNDNNGRVRKLFYNKVRKGAGSTKVNRTLTACELKENYLAEEDGAEQLVKIYKKARYSGEEVSDDEVAVCAQRQHR